MNEYVRIRSGASKATMVNSEFAEFVELVRADECPAGDYHLVVKDDGKPEPGEGQELAYTYEIQEDGVARKSYFLVASGTRYRTKPKRYSKLRLYAVLTKAGLWERLMEWLVGQTVEGMNAKTSFDLANELSDDHPLFAPMLEAAKSALGVTNEQVKAILAESEIRDQFGLERCEVGPVHGRREHC